MATEPAARRKGGFFLTLAAVLTAILVLAFARTFFLQPVFRAEPLTLALAVHGILGTGWFALLVWQAWLVRSGRHADHRRTGAYGKALVAAILLSTAWVVIGKAMVGGKTGSGLAASVGTFIQIGTALWFGGLATLGFRATGRPDYHKRCMIMATITMMAPAFSRITRLFRDGGPPLFDSAFLAVPLITALAVHDLRSLRRLHPVTLWAGLGYLVFVSLRLPMARSDLWNQTIFPAVFGI